MWITYYAEINVIDGWSYEAHGFGDRPWFASSAWLIPGTYNGD